MGKLKENCKISEIRAALPSEDKIFSFIVVKMMARAKFVCLDEDSYAILNNLRGICPRREALISAIKESKDRLKPLVVKALNGEFPEDGIYKGLLSVAAIDRNNLITFLHRVVEDIEDMKTIPTYHQLLTYLNGNNNLTIDEIIARTYLCILAPQDGENNKLMIIEALKNSGYYKEIPEISNNAPENNNQAPGGSQYLSPEDLEKELNSIGDYLALRNFVQLHIVSNPRVKEKGDYSFRNRILREVLAKPQKSALIEELMILRSDDKYGSFMEELLSSAVEDARNGNYYGYKGVFEFFESLTDPTRETFLKYLNVEAKKSNGMVSDVIENAQSAATAHEVAIAIVVGLSNAQGPELKEILKTTCQKKYNYDLKLSL